MSKKLEACTEDTYHVTRSDIPLSCPTREMRVYNAHPRVYLPIEETGTEVCPYCGAKFILDDFIVATENNS